MNQSGFQFSLGVDLFPLLAGTLAALACGLLGNFLVLRRLSLMGDAISHAVLPGLVIAYLVASTRGPLVMFLGAAAAGIATVVLVELVKRLGRVEPGAAMGVVFSILFALGVLLLETASLDHIDLDADCVLYGQLETLVWYGAPDELADALRPATLQALPRQVVTLAGAVLLVAVCIGALFKELRIAAFDPALATTQGIHAGFMHYLLMVLVACVTVASFEAVGSILVIAMLICPGATARLLTDRLSTQILLSGAIAIACGTGGYFAATALPAYLGKGALNAAGSMSVVAGILLAAAIVASPRHGVVPRVIRRRRLATRVALDDILATLYRAEETGATIEPQSLQRLLVGRPVDAAIARAVKRRFVHAHGQTLTLTDAGRSAAQDIVRKHRVWETYLVGEAGISPDHVHETAEQLEHLDPHPPVQGSTDPHGRPIPGKHPPHDA